MFYKNILSLFLVPFVLLAVFSSIAIAGISEQERRLRALEEKAGVRSELLKVLERFTWGGDFRLRYQFNHRDQAGTNTLDRDRFRLRFRLGATVHIYRDLDIGFRMATGGLNTQTSANQTFDNGFGHKALDLHRAFIKWSPNELTFTGGKFAVPFMQSDMIWDGDVNVEGVSEQYTQTTGNTEFRLVLGQFVVDEINPGDDIILFAYQGIIAQKTNIGTFKTALAYYDYSNHEDPASAPSNSISNNTLSEVKVLDIMGEWSEIIYRRKFTLFGEYAQNTGSLAPGQSDLDTAWNAGVKYGKSGKKFGDWEIMALYRVVQAEAVLDVLADSDFHNGFNNSRGFKVQAGFGLRKGIKVGLTYFDTEAERGAKDDKEILQADLVFKF